MRENDASSLSEAFLSSILAELNDDATEAIVLHGSYVRGDAFPPYSDVDLVRIVQESSAHHRQKRFVYRDGYLLSISSRPISVYRQRFVRPESAIFAIPGVREARTLLDKHGEFQQLQQEAWRWTWEPLQGAADAYASQVMLEQTEIVLKLLRALVVDDRIALSEMIIDLFTDLTDAVAVQRGVLVESGNTYFRQVQASVGQQSVWTHSHLRVAGVTAPPLSLQEQGREVLVLYKETAHLLEPSIRLDHWDVIVQTIQMLENTHLT